MAPIASSTMSLGAPSTAVPDFDWLHRRGPDVAGEVQVSAKSQKSGSGRILLVLRASVVPVAPGPPSLATGSATNSLELKANGLSLPSQADRGKITHEKCMF